MRLETLRQRLLAAVLAPLGVLAFAGAAYATNLYILGDNYGYSQVSGIAGASELIGHDGDYQAVWGVTWHEHYDAPCGPVVNTRHLNTGTQRVGTESNGSIFECPQNWSPKTVQFTNQDTYVRGIAVCLNGAGNKLKGLRLYGTKLNKATGALEPLNGYKEVTRPNCATWKPAKFCGADRVASRVDFQFYQAMTGARLECRKVEPK